MSLFIDVQWRAIKLNIGLYFKSFFFFLVKLEVVTLNAFHEEIFFYLMFKKNFLFLVEGNVSCDKLTSTRLANYFSHSFE